MPVIPVNEQLSIYTGDGRGVVFTMRSHTASCPLGAQNVSIRFSSMVGLLDELKRGGNWEADDMSLVASVQDGEIGLLFRMQAPPYSDVPIRLNRDDSARFLELLAEALVPFLEQEAD